MHALTAIVEAGTVMTALGMLTYGAMAGGTFTDIEDQEA